MRYPKFNMSQRSATLEGFRVVFRHPSLALAEVSWRWTVGGAACILLTLSAFEYLDSLPVTTGEALFLKTRHPYLVSQAIARILAGSGERVVAAGMVLTIALTTLWVAACSLGRAATIQPLLQYFSALGSARDGEAQALGFWRTQGQSWHLRSLLGLNFLRTSLVLAGVLAIIGSGYLVGIISTPEDPKPVLAFLLFLVLGVLVVVFWSSMNWLLSIASIFVLRDGSDVLSSISSAVEFCLRRAGSVSFSSTVFAVCHLVVFVIASSVVVFPLAFVGILPGWIIFGAVLTLNLLYFAVVDFFYVGRLAAYVCILQTPEQTSPVPDAHKPLVTNPVELSRVEPAAATVVPEIAPETVRVQAGSLPPIPPSEDDILSDVPQPAPEPPSNERG